MPFAYEDFPPPVVFNAPPMVEPPPKAGFQGGGAFLFNDFDPLPGSSLLVGSYEGFDFAGEALVGSLPVFLDFGGSSSSGS